MNRYSIHLINRETYRLKRAIYFFGLCCFYILSSCSQDPVIASVDDSELKESEAKMLMAYLGYDETNPKARKQFLESWVEKEALKLELQAKFPDLSNIVRLRANTYEGELSQYYLEEKEIELQLDTIFSENELREYYSKNKEEFILQDYLVKALFIKIPKGQSIEKEIKSHFLLKNDKDISKMNSFAKIYAEDYYFDDKDWIYFNDLVKDIPLKGLNIDNIVLNRTKTYFSSGNSVYFLNIIDFKLKDSAPPYEFLKSQLKELILNQRINSIRENIKPTLIRKTKSNHEIYINY